MICEKCSQNDATIHLTEIIKNEKSEVHLCERCAREIGLNSKLSNFSISIPEMLSFLDLDEIDKNQDINQCRTCGFSYINYSTEGNLGCPDCYTYLKDQIMPVIAGFHGEKKTYRQKS